MTNQQEESAVGRNGDRNPVASELPEWRRWWRLHVISLLAAALVSAGLGALESLLEYLIYILIPIMAFFYFSLLNTLRHYAKSRGYSGLLGVISGLFAFYFAFLLLALIRNKYEDRKETTLRKVVRRLALTLIVLVIPLLWIFSALVRTTT